MKVYRNICTYIWNDDKFPFASDDCQLIWFHLFTNPLSSPIGVYRATVAGLAEDKNRNGEWPLERYRKAFHECLEKGFIAHDPKALLIGFPKYFSLDHLCNGPANPNVLKNWGKRYNDLPESPLKDHCYQTLKAFLEGFMKAPRQSFMEAFNQSFREPFGKDIAIPDPLSLIPESRSLNPESLKNKEKNEAILQRFARFWEVYPNKTGKGKVEQWFLRHRPSDEQLDIMIAKVIQLTKSEKWKEDRGRFIPLPYTWLFQKRWEDGLPPEAPPKPRMLIT